MRRKVIARCAQPFVLCALLTCRCAAAGETPSCRLYLTTARDAGCGTIVVGRESFSWVMESFHSHVSDELVQEGQGLAIWIVQ